MRRAFPAAAILALGVSVCWADTLEDVEKKLVAAAEKLTSFQAKMRSVQDMAMGEVTNKSRIEGQYEYVRKDGKALYRMEAKTSGVIEMKGAEPQKMDGNTMVVCDGEYAYTYNEAMGQKMAFKMKSDPKMSVFVDKQFLSMLKKDHDLTLMPDEKIDGKDCWVVQAVPKKPEMIEKFVYYFQKETGIGLKTIGKDKAGKDITVTELSDVKMNVTIPADRFVFKAPEGVTVQDMSKLAEDAKKSEEPEKP
ncbi:MAG: hypothetical protein U1D55_16400 [Phycisphaerae bacterium]